MAINDDVNIRTYDDSIRQLTLLQEYGPFRLKNVNKELVVCSWWETIKNIALAIFSKQSHEQISSLYLFIKERIHYLNAARKIDLHNPANITHYFKDAQFIDVWNKQFGIPQSFWGRVQQWLISLTSVDWTAIKNMVSIDYSLPVPTPTVFEKCFSSSCFNEQRLPHVLRPLVHETFMSTDTFCTWVKDHAEDIKRQMRDEGALLFRNVPVNNASDFAAVLESIFGPSFLDDKGDRSQHEVIPGKISTETNIFKKVKIPVHHELSVSTKQVPNVLGFFCDNPPEVGRGQLTLAGSYAITDELSRDAEFWNTFKDKVVRYTSRYPKEGQTILETFGTEDPKGIQHICEQKGYTCRWVNDCLEVTREAPAMRSPPHELKKVFWYNQIHLFFNQTMQSRSSEVSLKDSPPISEKHVAKINETLEKFTLPIQLQKGDVLLVDNYAALHGFNPDIGDRRILMARLEY